MCEKAYNRSNPLLVFYGAIVMATATARHILVESEDECNQIKTQIDEGSSFEAMAKDHFKCPSG